MKIFFLVKYFLHVVNLVLDLLVSFVLGSGRYWVASSYKQEKPEKSSEL